MKILFTSSYQPLSAYAYQRGYRIVVAYPANDTVLVDGDIPTDAVVFVWGGRPSAIGNVRKVFNKRRALSKQRTFRILSRYSIPTVKTLSVEEWMADPTPCLARLDGLGKQQGMVYVESTLPDVFDFLVEYIPPKVIARYHIGRIGNVYEIIAVQHAIPREEQKRDGKPYLVSIRIRDGLPLDVPSEADCYAVEAMAALRMDYGAVEVLISDTGVYVLEINSVPELNRRLKKAYIDLFDAMYESVL